MFCMKLITLISKQNKKTTNNLVAIMQHHRQVQHLAWCPSHRTCNQPKPTVGSTDKIKS